MSENEKDAGEPKDSGRHSRRPIGLLFLWSTVVAIPGGYACGHALAAFSTLGSFAFLLLGLVAGWTARVVVGIPEKLSAACLSIACLIACFIALVFRLRLTDPTIGWREAFAWLGPSLSSDKVFATSAIGCAILGSVLSSLMVLRAAHKGPTNQAVSD